MKPTIIEKMYKNGYRTKMIVCKIASVIADRYDIPEKEYGSVLTDVYYGNIDEDETYFNCRHYEELPIPKWMEQLYRYSFESSKKQHYEASSEDKIESYTFSYPSEDGSWRTRKKPSRCIISISSDGEMSLTKLSGVNPTAEQAAAMVTAAAKRALTIHSYDRSKRRYAFNITIHEGMSGCRDVQLDLYERVGAHYRKLRYGGDNLHISMAGKVADFGMYVGDALEILNAYADKKYYESANFKMYLNTEEWLKDLGIKYSKPPRVNIIMKEVTFDPSK